MGNSFRYTVVMCVLFSLTGCTLYLQDFASKYDDVVSNTKKICKFVPTAQTLNNLFGVPGIGPAIEIAKKICAAVDKLPGAESGYRVGTELTVIVDGIEIEGSVQR